MYAWAITSDYKYTTMVALQKVRDRGCLWREMGITFLAGGLLLRGGRPFSISDLESK